MNRRGFLGLLCKGVATAVVAAHIPLRFVPAPISREAEKITLIRRMLQEGLDAHDRFIERAIFTDSYDQSYKGLTELIRSSSHD